MTLWEVDIYPAWEEEDVMARGISADAADLGVSGNLRVVAGRGYLLQGDFDEQAVAKIAHSLLADNVVERTVIGRVPGAGLVAPPGRLSTLVQVLPKPGVMDPVAQSAQAAIADLGFEVSQVRTLRKYWLSDLSPESRERLTWKVLANRNIEDAYFGPLPFDRLEVGRPAPFELITEPVRELSDEQIDGGERVRGLSFTPAELKTIRDHFHGLGRDPTDCELETIAQTWSEHCSHKTLAGRIAYRDEAGERHFDNMLKETIFAATQEIRRDLGEDDWCVSVFEDNAGVIRFDDQHNVAFKVETHNHPSALEPYGGANTGIGGVIRDTLGTGLGAKPVCNTDVFCFAPPDTPAEALPEGVLHPRRVMRGVVAGVRDYGNRMGIPTVNGAVYFDPDYLGNPLVYCGNVGILPKEKSFKEPQPDDLIVAIGGRTGRDGIHGAVFSSEELHVDSEEESAGAVQIGNAIMEKMLLDVLLAARDAGLYHAVTDCGAGGFSSAVGEMGEKIGAEVDLEKAPLKYKGLTYTEIWISEAQERMVLAVPPDGWDAFRGLCAAEGVEATVLGAFRPTGRLTLRYEGNVVCDLAMDFLHEGRPPVVRQAVYSPPEVKPQPRFVRDDGDYTATLLKLLAALNIASKQWIIRQYDHEVQGGSVIKPLVGIANDGPGDAAVVRPLLGSRRGLVIGCGMNPCYGPLDTYHMAASAIDEAVRNCVAVGADPARIAILDNFCWGYTDRPETLGSLVRAALACHDVALELGTPFISGKDSLNNEFSYDDGGQRKTISIPPSLLISAMGQVADVARCVTMNFKQSGSRIYLVGLTQNELGGSHLHRVESLEGGRVPQVDPAGARQIFAAVHRAIDAGLVRACHDLSEGGLAVAAAEMAFAGGLGARLSLDRLPRSDDADDAAVLLFSESNTRFLCEVAPDAAGQFEAALGDVPHAAVGQVSDPDGFVIDHCLGGQQEPEIVIDVDTPTLRETWKAPLRWE